MISNWASMPPCCTLNSGRKMNSRHATGQSVFTADFSSFNLKRWSISLDVDDPALGGLTCNRNPMIVFSRRRKDRSLKLLLRTNFVLALKRWSSWLFAHHKLTANDKVKVSIRTVLDAALSTMTQIEPVLSGKSAVSRVVKLNFAISSGFRSSEQKKV